ncbi:hypothetical protein SAMN04490357_7679 [Streptomyces misionensis]|uniref:Uncharacterized protein n=1 Tax=Streptomyces misionensis TaxID=67331 RepID=A0A1H5K2Y5_9ACTN|nr:hypothetical protein [Streptomyces misionensis]SEE59075.1 hypothetical protein SAMN04490357_7679 [Streptomyces misionensis]
MTHLIRAARRVAGLAVALAHMLLALCAGDAAGTLAWQDGYTIPLDTTSSAAWNGALVIALLTVLGVLLLPEPWVTQLRYLVMGRPVAPCPECGGLATQPDDENGPNTNPKEIAQ